jgi:hypothetical protein
MSTPASALAPQGQPQLYQPTGGLFQPQGAAFQPVPYLGLTSNERSLQAAIPSLQTRPMVQTSMAPLPNSQAMAFLAQQTGGAVSASNDPRVWTPEEAAAQTDRALARIGQANPELARTLAAQAGKQVEAPDNRSFFQKVIGGVGEILHVTHLDQVMEVMGRTAHIVPEIVHDWGKESVWQNTWQSLSGHSTTSWDDVLADSGVLGHGLLGSVIGFGLDIATDPLTYVTLGMGGLGREAAAKTAAIATTEAALRSGSIEGSNVLLQEAVGVARKAAEKAGVKLTEDELVTQAAKGLFGLTEPGQALAEKAATGVVGRARELLGLVHPDARAGAMFATTEFGQQQALQEVLRLADVGFKQSSTGGFARWSAEAASKFGIDKSAVENILKSYVGRGTGVGIDKTAYQFGKEAAASLGGVRLRFSIPVLDIRMAGQRLAFIPRTMDFSLGRRFAAGLSGQVRLMKMISRTEAATSDMEAFWHGGYKELKKANPAVARKLGGGARSPFYSASEAVGGLTAHFSSHAKVLRGGGLGARYAAQTNVMSNHIYQQAIDDIQTVRVGDKALNGRQVAERVGQAESKLDEAGQLELYDALNEYRSLVPTPGTTASNVYDARIKAIVENGESYEGELAHVREAKDRAVKVEARIKELSQDSDLGDIWRQVEENRTNAVIGAGETPDTWNEELQTLDDIHPDDATRYSPDQTTWEADGVSTTTELNDQVLTDTGDSGVAIRGLHGRKVGQIGDSPRLADVTTGEHGDLVQELANAQGESILFGAEPSGLAGKVAKNGSGTWEEVTKGLSPEETQTVLDHLRIARAKAQGILVRSNNANRPASDMFSSLQEEAANIMERQARETSLSPEEVAFKEHPQLAFVGPRRTLHIDRSTTTGELKKADEAVDPVAEIENEIRPVLEAMRDGQKPALDGLDEDAAQVVRDVLEHEDKLDAQLADITTEILRKRGYTDVEIAHDGGTEVVSLFDPGTGTVPMARVNPGAARVVDGGSQLRATTSAAREAASGVDSSKGNQLIRSIMRATSNMPRDAAERKARAMMAEAGKALKPHEAFFETKPLAALEQASHDAASRVRNQFIGKAMRSAENLGLSRGGYGAGPVGLAKYNVVLSEQGARWAQGLDDARKSAMQRAAQVSDEHLAVLRREAERLGEETQNAQRHLDELAENNSSRLNGVLNEIRRNTKDEERMATPEDAARKMDTFGRAMDMAFNEGDPAAYTHIGESSAVPGAQIYRVGDPQDITKGVTYVTVEQAKDGTRHIISMRKVGASITDTVERNVSAALTRDGYEHLGLGGELADVHWHDMGISGDWDKMSRAIAAQEFYGTGGGMAAKYVKRQAQSIMKDARSRAKGLERQYRDAQKKLDDASQEALGIEQELNNIAYRQSSERAPVMAALVPKEDALRLTGMRTVALPGFEDHAMPAFMAEEFEHAMRGFPKLDGAHAHFRQFMSWWKTMATWVNPGFHVRNMEGGIFNNWLGGVTVHDYFTTGRIRMAAREISRGEPGKWAKMTLSSKEPDLVRSLLMAEPSGVLMGKELKDLTYGDLAKLTQSLNINASNGRMFAEAALPAEIEAKKYAGRKNFVERIPKFYTKPMRGAGTMTENVLRGASFVRGLRDGRSVMESRAFTMMRHGDYEDLTDWEYKWVRDLIPFYKWMRTNTPFQIHQLLESPGKLLAVQKAQRAVYSAKGLNYDAEQHRVPEWMGDSFTIPFGVAKDPKSGLSTYDTVMLDLPMSDMFMSGREFVSSFLPTVRPFLESYIFHQSTFSAKPLTGKPVEMNPIFTPIAGLLSATGLVTRGADGKAYMSDQTNNLLGIIPIYSRFKNFIFEDPNGASASKRMNVIASAAFGLQLRPVDQAALSSTELNFYYDQVLPTMDYLRGTGYTLPTTDDLSATLGTTDQILKKLGIQAGPPTDAAAA